MEQLSSQGQPNVTLVARIKALLDLASKLIIVFDEMLQECRFNADLGIDLHRQWIEDAKANIDQYRLGLLKARTG